MYVDMNCQQISKISRKKTTEVKIFQKVLGGTTLFRNTLYTYIEFQSTISVLGLYSHTDISISQ